MSRQMPEEFERWVDASIYSQKASEIIGNFKDVIFPLEKTKNKTTLENMWKYINMVCTCMLAVRIVTDGCAELQEHLRAGHQQAMGPRRRVECPSSVARVLRRPLCHPRRGR